MSWLHKGSDAIADAEKKNRSTTLGKGRIWRIPDRFWMPYNTAKEIVFIDGDGIGVYEHAPYIGGTRKGNWFSCPGGMAYCCTVIGQDYKNRYLIVFYTVLDCTPWEDKEGKVHQYDLKLFGAKFGTYEKLGVKKAEDGLAGCLYKARRYKQNMEPGVGSEHGFKRQVEDLDALFTVAHYKGKLLTELWDEAEKDPEKMESLKQVFDLQFENGALVRRIPSFNYETILEPPSEEEIKVFLAGYKPGSGYSNNNNSGGGSKSAGTSAPGGEAGFDAGVDEDDIPF